MWHVSLSSKGIVLIYCLKIPIPVSQLSLAVVSEDVLLVSTNQHSRAVEATGQSVQPGHVQSTGAVAVWHRKAPAKIHHIYMNIAKQYIRKRRCLCKKVY